jgi:alkylation response protein AidB-like acyl-CoA dehydrogenase
MPVSMDDFDAVAQDFDRSMGDPSVPTSVLSFARSVELDEAEEFPADAFEWARRSGLLDYLVPAASGGRLRSFEDAAAIMRVIARRDLSTAIIIGQTYLGAVHTWLSGSEPRASTAATRWRATSGPKRCPAGTSCPARSG